eukprot:m.252530 g.252530  ORF g.252530 m.252530 type:complete len:149 (+) comp19126_c0_seq13:1615-2061(+)
MSLLAPGANVRVPGTTTTPSSAWHRSVTSASVVLCTCKVVVAFPMAVPTVFVLDCESLSTVSLRRRHCCPSCVDQNCGKRVIGDEYVPLIPRRHVVGSSVCCGCAVCGGDYCCYCYCDSSERCAAGNARPWPNGAGAQLNGNVQLWPD